MTPSIVEEILGPDSGLTLRSGRDVYVGVGSAERVIDWLRAHNQVILGIEGFYTDGVALRPLIEFIADFSTLHAPDEGRAEAAAREALAVVRDWDRGPQFLEFTIDD